MLSQLPPDILFCILHFLPDIHKVNTLTQVNKYLYTIIDDKYYTLWAYNCYGKDFWIRAAQRTPEVSNPLRSMKYELMRLEEFSNNLKSENSIWTNKDFYKFWDVLETVYNTKIKNNIKSAMEPNNISIQQ
jgi:hypothetical protein